MMEYEAFFRVQPIYIALWITEGNKQVCHNRVISLNVQ